jgi:hypothetical protein
MDASHFCELQTNDLVRKRIAKVMALNCFRNTELENLHAGKTARTETGDYSDVKVVCPDREIPWNELSRFNNDEMKAVMIDVVDHCYDFLTELFGVDGDALIEKLKLQDDVPNWNDPHGGSQEREAA